MIDIIQCWLEIISEPELYHYLDYKVQRVVEKPSFYDQFDKSANFVKEMWDIS